MIIFSILSEFLCNFNQKIPKEAEVFKLLSVDLSAGKNLSPFLTQEITRIAK